MTSVKEIYQMVRITDESLKLVRGNLNAENLARICEYADVNFDKRRS